ncbi:AbiTii domain-containing protein [Entomobacter blattae]|uniref:AbiTii n=1 Tax=Entomobacter blattae TaxID=2762277 RepID=A0A7H1NQ14_9PROT|nr:hypothetical protein [Entomobacter blattae]QNT77874.1 AbiTii [Entomobacter blattae]
MSLPIPLLIKAAASSSTPLAELLRNGLVIAQRSHQEAIAKWLTCELNGYPSHNPIPFYRHITVYDEKQESYGINLLQPIGVLESMVHTPSSFLDVTEPQSGKTLKVTPLALQPVMEMLRNLITEWGLAMEKNGITGDEEGNFSQEDKQKVQTLQLPSLQLDNADKPAFPILPTEKYNKNGLQSLVEILEKETTNPQLDAKTQEELQAALITLRAQLSLNKPQWSIIYAVHSTLKEIVDSGRQMIPYLSELFPL